MQPSALVNFTGGCSTHNTFVGDTALVTLVEITRIRDIKNFHDIFLGQA